MGGIRKVVGGGTSMSTVTEIGTPWRTTGRSRIRGIATSVEPRTERTDFTENMWTLIERHLDVIL